MKASKYSFLSMLLSLLNGSISQRKHIFFQERMYALIDLVIIFHMCFVPNSNYGQFRFYVYPEKTSGEAVKWQCSTRTVWSDLELGRFYYN